MDRWKLYKVVKINMNNITSQINNIILNSFNKNHMKNVANLRLLY